MFPLQFDRKMLESLPVPEKEGVRRILAILHALIGRRIIPYFKKRRTIDPTLTVKVAAQLNLERLADESGSIQIVSLATRQAERWNILIHERVFDYMAFVIPSDPDARLGGGTLEEGQILALAEFMLRHEIEHMLHPEKSEREVVRTDVHFALERRREDPTFYRMLRNVLADEMNGLKGAPYLALFDSAERERPYEYLITRVLDPLPGIIAAFPPEFLFGAFNALDPDLKTKVLGELYQRSRDTSYPLVRRVELLRRLLKLFSLSMAEHPKETHLTFSAFKDHWGLIYLFRELEIPESALEGKDLEEIYALFMERIPPFIAEKQNVIPTPPQRPRQVEPEPSTVPGKGLKERIEDARNDPDFPRQALEVIDKNKVAAVGHSGPKYTELIETLLAIPWGKIQPLNVSPEGFEAGLHRSHYGLEKPKEILCDFFANLIWRYQRLNPAEDPSSRRTGSAFLFVGPPGVGKTSLAISIARNLGIPYHKVSLGGMRDEADLRGHGFTYEGSKPGAVVQGLIKMGVMNGMFILDEADKTEKFAVSTLLEILDPEQNHLFHDKYTMTTVDIDLSNSHFILTANTLETVAPPVMNRCEVVVLGRYSVDEKVAIGREYLVERVRRRYHIGSEEIFFDPAAEEALIRYLVKGYTHEPGVRELERIIRTLFLRLLRKEILGKGEKSVCITRQKIKYLLETPAPPRQINEEDRVGEMLAVGVDVERGLGSIIPIQATPIRGTADLQEGGRGYLSMVQATGNIEKIMDESRKVALTGITFCADAFGIDLGKAGVPIHLHFMGASSKKDGPSAGGAIALAIASTLAGRPLRRDVAMTGEIDTQGRLLGAGALDLKLETAYDAGCKTMIIPQDNLTGEGGVERLPEALKQELQVLTYPQWKGQHEPFDYALHTLQIVAVGHILEAADVAFIVEKELLDVEETFVSHARRAMHAAADTAVGGEDRLCLVYAKTADELDLAGFETVLGKGFRCIFLLPPAVKAELARRYPWLPKKAVCMDFDPPYESSAPLTRTILDQVLPANKGRVVCLHILAPYFFLLGEEASLGGLGSHPVVARLQLLASNYTLQGLKIKGCKPHIHRLHLRFLSMPAVRMEECPFLACRNGVVCIDISPIPEKYRLNLKRTEEITNRALDRWLQVVARTRKPKR